MLRKYLVPEDKICLDMDWFYRKGGLLFLWIAKHPIQWFDTAWGEAYRVVGLGPLMVISRFWSWFDWHGIDGVVDGFARVSGQLAAGYGHCNSDRFSTPSILPQPLPP
jgi:multicomponent Na+:H+ antiporter subunit D